MGGTWLCCGPRKIPVRAARHVRHVLSVPVSPFIVIQPHPPVAFRRDSSRHPVPLRTALRVFLRGLVLRSRRPGAPSRRRRRLPPEISPPRQRVRWRSSRWVGNRKIADNKIDGGLLPTANSSQNLRSRAKKNRKKRCAYNLFSSDLRWPPPTPRLDPTATTSRRRGATRSHRPARVCFPPREPAERVKFVAMAAASRHLPPAHPGLRGGRLGEARPVPRGPHRGREGAAEADEEDMLDLALQNPHARGRVRVQGLRQRSWTRSSRRTPHKAGLVTGYTIRPWMIVVGAN